jgi:hypothetical protein
MLRTCKTGRIVELQASVEDDLLGVAEEMTEGEARWNRPRKRRIALRVDIEVVDWFQSKGPSYQTRINRILEKSDDGGQETRGGEIERHSELPHSGRNRA